MDIEEAKEKMKFYAEHYVDSMADLFKTVLSELEKKDKVINEMAIVIDGEDEVLYCTRMSHIKDNYCNTRNCTDCIKEYFTNKVEREGK